MSRRSYGSTAAITLPSKGCDEIRIFQHLDCSILPAKRIVKQKLQMKDYFYRKGLFYHIVPTNNGERAQLVVHKDLRSQLIKWYHDHPTSEHFGLTKSNEKIRQKCYWLGIYKDVEQWIKTYITCAQKKGPVNESNCYLCQ